MTQIDSRRQYTNEKTTELQNELQKSGKSRIADVCSCATGSFGRLEAGPHSDLDMFLLSRSSEDVGPKDIKLLKPSISNQNTILIKAGLIEANFAVGLPPFDADGKYLTLYTIEELIERIGRSEDESTNSFTSRLLLLLEGRPIVGSDIFSEAVERIISSYWRDYKGHERNFAPAFMSNDILRLWRTFCVNYEARTSVTPIEKKIKRKVKNYKLKYSRMLTCYSALLCILSIYNRNGTVTIEDMGAVCSFTPLQRVEWLKGQEPGVAAGLLSKIENEYEVFLEVTDCSQELLEESFRNATKQRELLERSYTFADSVFETINCIGKGSKMHRMLVV